MPMTRRRQKAMHNEHAPLPDELWALVLSKCSWQGAWPQVKPLLLWRPGAAAVLFSRDDLLAGLLHAQRQAALPLYRAAQNGRGQVVQRLMQLDEAAGADRASADSGRYQQRVAGLEDVSELECALSQAAHDDRAGVVAMLMSYYGRNVNGVLALATALVTAARWGRMEVMSVLLAHEAFSQAPFSWMLGLAPCDPMLAAQVVERPGRRLWLSLLALAGQESIIRILLLHGMSQQEKEPVLRICAACGQLSVLEVLLDHDRGVPVDMIAELLNVPAIRERAAVMQLLMECRSMRTRAARQQCQVALNAAQQQDE